MGDIPEKATTDEIVRETRQIKEEFAKSFDCDIDRILENARKKQAQDDRTVLSPPVDLKS